MRCSTVKICGDSKNRYIVINESDFDDKKHKLFNDKPSKPKKAKKVK